MNVLSNFPDSPDQTGLVTVSHPKADLPQGTVNIIFKQAELKATRNK